MRVLEAEPAEADLPVIHAVAIEVNDVIGLAGTASAVELLAQGGQRGRAEHVEAHETAEFFHRLDQRQRARAVIEVAAGVVLRTGGDEQDADGRGDHRHVEHARIRQAPADARRLRALEQEAVAVVQKFPREAEQECGRFAGGLDVSVCVAVGCAGFERRIDVDGEPAAGMSVDPGPGVYDVRRVCAG